MDRIGLDYVGLDRIVRDLMLASESRMLHEIAREAVLERCDVYSASKTIT